MSIVTPDRAARQATGANPRSEASVVVRRLPRPRPSRALGSDILAGGGFILLVTLGLWWTHGGMSTLLGGGVETLSGIGQASGLVAALAALGGLILTSRPRQLERRYGQDGLIAAHRWFGIVTVLAVVVHAVTDTWAWGAATGGTIASGLVDLLAHESWMVAATVGTVLMIVIGLSSWRRVRRLMPYETWYFVHLTGYLAVLLGFGHQLTLGADFATDTLAFWWWTLLAVATVVVVVYSRLADVARALTRGFYVTAVSREANGIGSLHVSGLGLRRLRVAGGQYFGIRALTPQLWWQSHPYSVSAAPTTAGLRFTVKDLGDASSQLLAVRPGTRLVLEGPYGVFTLDQAKGAPVVLVAGGVGVAPIRAMLEDARPSQRPMVIVRVHGEMDVAHRIELERMAAARGGSLHVLAGPRQWFARTDPFAPETLKAWIPDLASRHVFVCGPASLESAVMKGMRRAGVPSAHIHHERFGV
jgi:predicted ferric reductase